MNYTRPVWSDEIRQRLRVPPIEAKAPPEPPNPHYHIWVERGWAGTLSPALPDLHAANGEIAELLVDLGEPELVPNGSAPFTGSFIRIPATEGAPTESALRVTLGLCRGGKYGATQPCNKTGEWR